VKETAKIFSVFMQMTVLTLYAFLYGKAYLVSPNCVSCILYAQCQIFHSELMFFTNQSDELIV
jgi:hypothetical protein